MSQKREPETGPMSESASPCIQVCELDPRSQVCLGCGRTMQEIREWIGYDADARRAILRRLRGE